MNKTVEEFIEPHTRRDRFRLVMAVGAWRAYALMPSVAGGGNQPVADSADLRVPRTVNDDTRDT